MGIPFKQLFVSSLVGAMALSLVARPAQAGSGFGTGAIVGGIAGFAVGTMLSHGLRHHYYQPPRRVVRSAKVRARDDVIAVQRALNAFGFDAGPVNGQMNTQTRAAIVRFQSKMGEPATGTLTDDQQGKLLAAYAKRNQDNTEPTRTSKIDALFAAIGVNAAAGTPATPGAPSAPSEPTVTAAGTTSGANDAPSTMGPAIPNLGGMTTKVSAEPIDTTNMRAICRNDQMTAMLRESEVATFKTVRLVPDQFCAARSSVLEDAAEAYKALAKKPGGANPDRVRTECQRFAEAKRADIARLESDAPAKFARQLIKPTTKQNERDGAVNSSRICLGFGYADDKPEVVLASALVLVGFGETGYAELVGANLALGLGVAKNVSAAANWLDFAASEIDAGAPSVVKSDGLARAKVLRQVVRELQGKMAVAVIPAKADSAIIAPNLFGAPDASDQPPKQAAANPAAQADKKDTHVAFVDPKLADVAARMTRANLVERMREDVVLIYNADEGAIGTGFFISPTHVLTNTHVVGKSSKVVLINKTMRMKGGIVKYRGMTPDGVGIDAAIIEVLGYRNPTHLTFATSVQEGEDIAIGGYPYRALLADRGFIQFLEMIKQNQLPTTSQIPNTKFAFGFVQSVFTKGDTGLENIQEGVETTGGNSGSPLVNACGQVIALHYEGSQAEVQKSGDKFVVDASKFNFAISFREVLKFLRDADIPYEQASVSCPAH